MKTIAHITLALAALTLSPHAQVMKQFNPQIQTGGDLSVDKMREQNLIVVQKAVEGMRQDLPQKVDNFTKLIAVDSNATQLIYTFEVATGAKSDATLRQEGAKMAPRIQNGICHSAKRFMEADISLSYRYVSSATHAEVLRVDVDKSKCPEKL
jgi:hypothetical protein